MLAYTERLIALTEEHGFPFWQAGGLALRGRALAAQGRHAEGIALMTSALASASTGTNALTVAYFRRNLAEAQLEVGARDEALAAIAQGLDSAERSDLRSSEPEFHRIRGELLAEDPLPPPKPRRRSSARWRSPGSKGRCSTSGARPGRSRRIFARGGASAKPSGC